MMACSSIEIVDLEISKLAKDRFENAHVNELESAEAIPRDLHTDYLLCHAETKGLQCFGCGEINPNMFR